MSKMPGIEAKRLAGVSSISLELFCESSAVDATVNPICLSDELALLKNPLLERPSDFLSKGNELSSFEVSILWMQTRETFPRVARFCALF